MRRKFMFGPFTALLAAACVTVAPGQSSVPGTTAPGTLPPVATPAPSAFVPATVPPLTLPPITLPPVTLPPVTLAPPSLPPVTLPPVTPPPVPTTAPSASPSGPFLGTNTLLFTDEFEDQESGWIVGQGEGYEIAYVNNVGGPGLNISRTGSGNYLSTGRQLNGTTGALRFAALWEPVAAQTSQGLYGVTCRDIEGDLYGAGVGTDGTYFSFESFGGAPERITSRSTDVIAGTGPGSQVALMIECGVDANGNAETYFWVNDELLLHETHTGTELGPLWAAGIYIRSEGELFLATVREAAAWVGEFTPDLPATAAPTAPPAAVSIEDHIPADMLDVCNSREPSSEAIEEWQCHPDEDTWITHMLFADAFAMQAYFEDYLYDGLVEGSDCTSGDEEGHDNYTVGGEPGGEYMCGYDLGGALLVWTTPALNMVSELSNSAEDWDNVWSVWEVAGPTL